MKALQIAAWGMAVVLMGGCSLLGRSAPAQPDEPAPFEAPENSGRFIGAVGSAPQSADESVVLQMADEDARGKLADAVAEYAREVVVEFLATHKGYADPESERARAFESAVSKGAANAILRQDLRAESRRDPRSGRLCVVYRVPVSIVNDKISENARRALSPVSPFERSLEAKAMEELDEFLAATLKERVITASQRPEAEVDREIGNPPPAWLAYGRHQDYPRSTFMVAVGIGDSPEATVESARSDLRNRIAGRIPGLDVDDLLNVKLTASWYDPITDTHYGLGVLDRAQTTARCRERVRKALEEAHALLESAVNHHRADNFLTALRGYVEALANAQTVPKLARAAAVVEPARKAEFAELTKDAPLVEIELKLRELVGMFAMRKAGGDEQWTPPGVALPKPLKVLLTAGPNALPVAGLPLRFSFKAGRGRLQEVVRTDENGTAACPVECVEGNGEPFGAVECALALEELAPTVELPDMTGPAVVFNYVMRARSNTHLALYLVEDPGDTEPPLDPLIRDAVAAALTAAEFRLVDQDRVDGQAKAAGLDLTSETTEEQVLKAFEGPWSGLTGKGFVMIVVGVAHSELVEATETSRGTMYFVHTRVQLRACDRDLPAAKTVADVEAAGKDAFLDDFVEARRRARAKAAKLAADKLVSALNEKFGGE